MGPPSSHRYSFDMATAIWSNALLKNVWTDPNAPPSTGIIAACQLDDFEKLLVFTNTGMLYIQNSGVWKQPTQISIVFPDVTEPAKIADLYHIPSELEMPPTGAPFHEDLVIVGAQACWSYEFYPDNTVKSTGINLPFPMPTLPDDPPLGTVLVPRSRSSARVGQTSGPAARAAAPARN